MGKWDKQTVQIQNEFWKLFSQCLHQEQNHSRDGWQQSDTNEPKNLIFVCRKCHKNAHAYKKKWYPKEWIDIRVRWIPVRKWLTAERDERGGDRAYWLLTNQIYQAYLWMNNKERKAYKWMGKWNLRDDIVIPKNSRRSLRS